MIKGYIIQHHFTGEQWSTPKGKKVWEKPAHAKNAWRIANQKGVKGARFDSQTTWELVPLIEDNTNEIKEAIKAYMTTVGKLFVPDLDTFYELLDNENQVKGLLEVK